MCQSGSRTVGYHLPLSGTYPLLKVAYFHIGAYAYAFRIQYYLTLKRNREGTAREPHPRIWWPLSVHRPFNVLQHNYIYIGLSRVNLA